MMDFYEYEELLEEENRQNLQHHGIEGQKWGFRNGPPYPIPTGDHSAEEKRKNPRLARKEEKQRRKAEKKAKTEPQTKPKKTVHDLTNEELRQRTERMRLENDFMNKYYEQMRYENRDNVRKGSDWLKTAATVTASIGTVLFTADKVAKLFGVDIGQMAKEKFTSELMALAKNKYGPSVDEMDLDQLKKEVERTALESKFYNFKKDEFR